MTRLGDAIAFARHVPLRQIVRRGVLTLRRRIELHAPPALNAPAPPRVPDPPRPLMPPRQGLVDRAGDAARFTFLHDTRTLAFPPDPKDARGASQLWLMNLHYHEYLETLDDADVAAAMATWLDRNPPFRSGATHAAWNAYALSLRVTVWMQQIAARPAMATDDTILRALAVQLRYLCRYLETDIGGNHLVKNVKALIWAGAFFDGPESADWRRLGTRWLDHVLRTQMLADGMHFERSPSYHGQVFVDLLEIRHALAVPHPALDSALAHAAQVVADLRHPDGRVAQFGDSGLSMAYPPHEMLAAYGVSPAPRNAIAFPDAGYFGRRDHGDLLIVDAGPIATDALPAHAHGDMLSFEWSIDGQRIVVDQGVFEYLPGPRRDAARSANSHNVAVAQNADQGRFHGAFRLGARANLTDRSVILDDEAIDLSATCRFPGGGTAHHRRLTERRDRLALHDRVDRPAGASAWSRFLLHPDVTAERTSPNALLLICGPLRIQLDCDRPLTIESAVWWPDMGLERATTRIVAMLAPGVVTCATRFAVVARLQ